MGDDVAAQQRGRRRRLSRGELAARKRDHPRAVRQLEKRAAAEDPVVVRVLVNPAIKKALCREAGTDRTWLYKVRPWYGHAEHFHVQIACPADSAECKPPAPPLPSDGCGSELDFWFKESTLHPRQRKPRPVLTLAGLPPACKQIVKAP